MSGIDKFLWSIVEGIMNLVFGIVQFALGKLFPKFNWGGVLGIIIIVILTMMCCTLLAQFM